MRTVYILSFMCASLLLTGCEKDDPVGPDPNNGATLSEIQSSIFDVSCAVSGCHAGANPQMGMDLSDGQAYANIVNVASVERPNEVRIAPNNPNGSYLYRKLTGTDIDGARMPLGRSALSDAQLTLVREWIENGALDN